MKNLRERCEKLAKAFSFGGDNPAWANLIETFALEIRNEALEDAAIEMCPMFRSMVSRGWAADQIRALKVEHAERSKEK